MHAFDQPRCGCENSPSGYFGMRGSARKSRTARPPIPEATDAITNMAGYPTATTMNPPTNDTANALKPVAVLTAPETKALHRVS